MSERTEQGLRLKPGRNYLRGAKAYTPDELLGLCRKALIGALLRVSLIGLPAALWLGYKAGYAAITLVIVSPEPRFGPLSARTMAWL